MNRKSYNPVPRDGLPHSRRGPLRSQPSQLLRRRHKGPRISPLNHSLPVNGDLLPLLEEQKRRHGRDAVRPGRLLHVIDVDLCEGQGAGDGVLAGQGLEDGGDGLAGGAPVGEEVDGDVGGGGEEGLELREGVDVLDLVAHFVWCC